MRYWLRKLYVWVVVAIVAGGILGCVAPNLAVSLKPLGDAFIALVRMLVAPVIFLTVVLGIAGATDIKKAGRVGAKSILYFEVVSTFALGLGLLVVHLVRPGAGFNVDPKTLESGAAVEYVKQAQSQNVSAFLLHFIPKSFADAFTANGDLLQVVLVAVLFGLALSATGRAGAPVVAFFEALAGVFFGMVALVMRFAPVGAGAAMAYTLGKYGVASIGSLLMLLGSFYLACFLFIFGVLGLIARLAGFSIVRFLGYLREELLLVVGTSSSESALVPLMQKLERLGCSRSVVGLVVPSGYSFNLDGTNIYLTMAALFIAQALKVPLTWTQEATLLGVAMLTSKGASGVTGAGFVTLAATLAVVPSLPVAGLALILGIDRFMSEARALTNMIGNGVATIVVARWERELDVAQLEHELSGRYRDGVHRAAAAGASAAGASPPASLAMRGARSDTQGEVAP